jgi:hypothetical protein
VAAFSRGRARSEDETGGKSESAEWAASSEVPSLPTMLVANALSNADFAIEYVASEKVGESEFHHIRLWNTFSSKSNLRKLAPFTERHIWIDAVSGLPSSITSDQRSAGGAVPSVPLQVSYSDYRNVGRILFPFRIEKHVNGSLWATVAIQQVSLNTGLTDAEFPVR